MSKVLEIAKSINKAWKTDVITSADLIPECERFSMGTMSADYALYGGLPEGKLIVYAGESGSGKSLVAVNGMARYQEKHPNKTCVYVDAEETLRGQIGWFKQMTGLNTSPEQFARYDCAGKSAEEIFADIITLQEADDIGMIIIDSAPMLLSQADIDNEITKDNGQRASIAKSMGKFLKFMIPAIAKKGNPLLIINHTRVAGVTFTGAKIYTEPCGYALNYYPTLKVRFAGIKFTKGDKLDVSASQTDSETDGICCTFSVTKNRLGARNRNGAKLVFRYETGLDTLTDLIEIITKYEIAKRLSKMSWQLVDPITGTPYRDDVTGKELTFTGKQNMIDFIKSNDEFRKEYTQKVSEFINKTKANISLIDEEDLKEIIAAEAGVEKSMKEGTGDDAEDQNISITSVNGPQTSIDNKVESNDTNDTVDNATTNDTNTVDSTETNDDSFDFLEEDK